MEKEHEASLDDIIANPGVLRLLVTLDREGPCGLRALIERAELSTHYAIAQRDLAVEWGLISVSPVNMRAQLNSITPRGKRVLAYLYKMAEALTEARSESSDRTQS